MIKVTKLFPRPLVHPRFPARPGGRQLGSPPARVLARRRPSSAVGDGRWRAGLRQPDPGRRHRQKVLSPSCLQALSLRSVSSTCVSWCLSLPNVMMNHGLSYPGSAEPSMNGRSGAPPTTGRRLRRVRAHRGRRVEVAPTADDGCLPGAPWRVAGAARRFPGLG